jgi:hypothetical protein
VTSFAVRAELFRLRIPMMSLGCSEIMSLPAFLLDLFPSLEKLRAIVTQIASLQRDGF